MPDLYLSYKREPTFTDSDELNFGFMAAKLQIICCRIIFTIYVTHREYVKYRTCTI